MQINQGETYRQTFQWLQGGGKEPQDGEPVNLRSYTGRCQIRSGAQSPGIITTLPVNIYNAEEGRFSLDLTAAQTAAISTGGNNYSDIEKYTYDVEFTNSDGTVYRLLNGIARISPEVTK